eukprot:TRINITY_DN5414_c0_g2_i3.p1 TRINITY_DN5414_c0_g2~~TRINITY_DN5414_c0_g2_i3.p1  ORF type:complete len:262 (+),score=57.25 TRINITY_DN5414_c0_g2_i3:234-1019(+)
MIAFEPTLEQVFNHTEQFWPDLRNQVRNVYLWGSRVYGTATACSDWDFTLIVDDTDTPKKLFMNMGEINGPSLVIDDGVVNAKFAELSVFYGSLWQHSHEALQCYYSDKQYILKQDIEFTNFEVDPDVLRRSVGWESKSRYSRAKQTFAKDVYKAKKEIIHSIRYVLFAIQILKNGKIMDWECANEYYFEIMEKSEDSWGYYNRIYGEIRKDNMKLLSKFGVLSTSDLKGVLGCIVLRFSFRELLMIKYSLNLVQMTTILK